MVEEGEDVTLSLIYVQRPTPPLTEEELAAIKSAIWERNLHASYRRKASVTVDRLIADLRANRARIRELEESITHCSGSCTL